MEFGTFSLTISRGYKKVLDPTKTHTNNFGGIESFRPPKPHTLIIFGGIKRFLDPHKTHTNNLGGIKSF